MSASACAVCDDYGVYKGTVRACPHPLLEFQDGRTFLGGCDTQDVAARWFAGASSAELVDETGLSRAQLSLLLDYEAHRPR